MNEGVKETCITPLLAVRLFLVADAKTRKQTNKENMPPALDGLGVSLSKATLMKKG